MPSQNELNVLYQNCVAIGAFSVTDSGWSSTEYGPDTAAVKSTSTKDVGF
jgi:hypothetical protein